MLPFICQGLVDAFESVVCVPQFLGSIVSSHFGVITKFQVLSSIGHVKPSPDPQIEKILCGHAPSANQHVCFHKHRTSMWRTRTLRRDQIAIASGRAAIPARSGVRAKGPSVASTRLRMRRLHAAHFGDVAIVACVLAQTRIGTPHQTTTPQDVFCRILRCAQ